MRVWTACSFVGALFAICFTLGCSRLEPTEVEPVLVGLDLSPSEQTLAFGSTQEFVATGTFASDGLQRAVKIRWYLVGDPIGSLSALEGSSVRFTARSPGYALLIGVSADLADTARVTVTPPNPYPVFDGEVHDFLGVFRGLGDEASVFVLADPLGVRDDLVMQLDFTVSTTGFAGLFIERGSLDGHEIVDMRDYRSGHLEFMVRSTYDVQIGVRSDNITPGDERSKLWLREAGLARCDGQWEFVSVPLDTLARLEPGLDFTRMEVFLVAAVNAAHTFGSTSGSLWLASAAWTRD